MVQLTELSELFRCVNVGTSPADQSARQNAFDSLLHYAQKTAEQLQQVLKDRVQDAKTHGRLLRAMAEVSNEHVQADMRPFAELAELVMLRRDTITDPEIRVATDVAEVKKQELEKRDPKEYERKLDADLEAKMRAMEAAEALLPAETTT